MEDGVLTTIVAVVSSEGCGLASVVLEVVYAGVGKVDVPEEMAAPVPAPKPIQAERMEDASIAEMVAIAPMFLIVGRVGVVESSSIMADVVVGLGGRLSIELRVLVMDVVIPPMPTLLDVTSAPAGICCDEDEDEDDDNGLVV